ncbi:Transposase [Rubritalea squalenifaciens DSM 18772]|uniref:Transposase n=1 Tax=Rubritalea squalenifaciens DSM 18772 TaxID=1123071 RepID=A0A1M6SP49_9BACT|nr:transposase [Rubritalea squalenifaciens]SHK46399.1 Transposase [Rubritalea squalenifaciens DSM 18772]
MTGNEQDKDEIIAQLREVNRLLREKVDYLIRVIHGSSSEKVDASQLELLLDPASAKKQEAADGNEEPPAAEDLYTPACMRRRAPRKPRLPADIPTTETVLIPDEVEAEPDAYRQVGEKRSEKLDVIPARFIRKITVRPQYIRKGNPVPKWLIAPLPPCLLEGSILTPSLLAHVLAGKYCDHLPFHRQEQIMLRRHGVRIPY